MNKKNEQSKQKSQKELRYNPFPKEFLIRIRELNHKIAKEEMAKMQK